MLHGRNGRSVTRTALIEVCCRTVLCTTKLNISELTMIRLLQRTSLLFLLLVVHSTAHPCCDGWLSLAREVLGPQTQAAWLMDWQADAAQVQRSPGGALVIMHRNAGSIVGTGALFHGPIIGTGGTRLHPTAEADTVHGWLHASHIGRVQGLPVVVDHFLIPGVNIPSTLFRVVRPIQGSTPVRSFTELAFLRSLLTEARPDPDKKSPPLQRIVTGTDGMLPDRL